MEIAPVTMVTIDIHLSYLLILVISSLAVDKHFVMIVDLLVCEKEKAKTAVFVMV